MNRKIVFESYMILRECSRFYFLINTIIKLSSFQEHVKLLKRMFRTSLNKSVLKGLYFPDRRTNKKEVKEVIE